MKKLTHLIKSLIRARNCTVYISKRAGLRWPNGEPADMPEMLAGISRFMEKMRTFRFNMLLLASVSLAASLLFWLMGGEHRFSLFVCLFFTMGVPALILGVLLSVSFWLLTLIFTVRLLRKHGIEFFPFKQRQTLR